MSKFVAIIPVRMGSKRIENKNYQTLSGKSLIEITIAQAKESNVFDDILVTTDDENLEEYCIGRGVTYVRRSEIFATDQAKSIDAVQEALGSYSHKDTYCLLQVTSPLRTAKTIARAAKQFAASSSESLVSISVASIHPFKTLIEDGEQLVPSRKISDFEEPDQLLPKSFEINGALYFGYVSNLFEHTTFFAEPVEWFEMNEEESVDINTTLDLEVARALWDNKFCCN